MTAFRETAADPPDVVASAHELLLRLDLAMEVLEGLDELGLESRSQVEALLTRLEQQIADSD